jgi:5-aminopentanamidase
MPRIASVQTDVIFNGPAQNTHSIINQLYELAKRGVEIAVFPECVLTGYCVSNPTEAAEIAIPRSDSVFDLLQKAVDATGVVTVLGFAEQAGGVLRNTAALLEAGTPPRYYVKTHLPELGFDKHVEAGDDLPVFETSHGKIGILICFDCRFPEAARALALKGADLIAIPTNWPTGAHVSANVLAVARAAENKVFVATANRVGTENGFDFIGLSKIINPMGQILASAEGQSAVLVSDADFAESRQKRIVTIHAKYETTVFEARRPELYESLRD